MVQLPTFDDLRQYVLQVLCAQADLEIGAPLLESTLLRRGRPCGIEYLLFGPRSIRLSAIWEGLNQRILFYDHDLERFRTTSVNGPDASRLADRQTVNCAVKSMWKGK